MKRIITLPLFFLMTTCLYSQVLINEYSAANYDSYQDNYGEYEDWVEIYNGGAAPIDINGWYLSDKSDNPMKWQVPGSLTIPGLGSVVIFCSGRDEIQLVGGNPYAHTNFKITQTKGNEVFMLSDNSGVLQDSISVRPNIKTHSRGRETSGSPNWSVFIIPTPTAMNTGSFQEYASTPVFSIPSGYYSGSSQVIITSPDPNISIYYTTDGSAPDNTSTQYTTPITFTQTTVLKAMGGQPCENLN